MIKNSVQYVAITPKTKALYNSFADRIKDGVELTEQQGLFLLQLVLDFQPQKVLEMGVASGGSAAIILHGIKHNPKARLVSLDILETLWRDSSKPVGYLISQHFPELLDQWSLFIGSKSTHDLVSKEDSACYTEHFPKFLAQGQKNSQMLGANIHCANIHFPLRLEEIGTEIDFYFLDTAHCCPGEILDFLIMFPYLKDECMLVLHDVHLHMYLTKTHFINHATGTLLSSLKGQKYLPSKNHDIPAGRFPFVNIGAVKLDKKQTEEHIYDVFNLLSLPWNYDIEDHEMAQITEHFRKFYDEELVQMFIDIRNHYHQKNHHYWHYIKQNEGSFSE